VLASAGSSEPAIAAADDLHIAQQAVSQQIKALERSLGVTLLRYVRA